MRIQSVRHLKEAVVATSCHRRTSATGVCSRYALPTAGPQRAFRRCARDAIVGHHHSAPAGRRHSTCAVAATCHRQTSVCHRCALLTAQISACLASSSLLRPTYCPYCALPATIAAPAIHISRRSDDFYLSVRSIFNLCWYVP